MKTTTTISIAVFEGIIEQAERKGYTFLKAKDIILSVFPAMVGTESSIVSLSLR